MILSIKSAFKNGSPPQNDNINELYLSLSKFLHASIISYNCLFSISRFLGLHVWEPSKQYAQLQLQLLVSVTSTNICGLLSIW
mgnify:CR=1 FL=1